MDRNGSAKPPEWRRAAASRTRALALRTVASAINTPMLRLSLGRWPSRSERVCANTAFCRVGDTVSPLLRSLASLPAGRDHMARALIVRGGDATIADQVVASAAGVSGAVWLGPKLSVLHLEKTGGHSLLAWLRGHLHPRQIDPDPSRSVPADLFSAFPPSQAAALDRYSLVWGHYDLPALRRLGRQREVLTLLREPADRLVSLYRYWRSVAPDALGPASENLLPRLAQRLSLLEFLTCDDPLLLAATDNFYLRRLTGRYPAHGHLALGPDDLADALAALASIAGVGITEDMPQSLRRFAALLGLPPPAAVARLNRTDTNHRDNPRHHPAPAIAFTPAIRAALEARVTFDRAIYAAALARLAGHEEPRPCPDPAGT